MSEVTSAIPLSKVEPLNGVNYQVWALKISAVLRSKKLFKEIIEDEEPSQNVEPGSNEAKTREIWETKNNEAFGIIIVTLAEEQAGLFIGETNAKKVWLELKRIYAGNIEDKKIDISLELKDIKMGNDETVDSYITRARNIASRSAVLGQIISTRELVYHVVRGIHPRLERIAMVLRTQRSACLEDVQQSLREEEARLNLKSGSHLRNSEMRTEKAYKAKEWNADWKKKGQANRKPCYICGRTNHFAKDCYYKQGNQQRHQQRSYKPSEQRALPKVPPKNRSEHAFSSYDGGEEKINTSHDAWHLDSGCTSHMTPHIEYLTEATPFKTVIRLAEDGREIESEAIGNIHTSTVTSDGETKDICIKNVLFVPKLRTNLLSVKCLAEKGNKILFERESVKVLGPNGDLLAEPKMKNDMYILETRLRESNAWSADECTNKATEETTPKIKRGETDKYLWHCRMGHLNESYMNQMKRKEMVYGLKYEESENLEFCEGCTMGKLAQTPFKTSDNNVAFEPLEVIHMDLCGPLPIPSLGGAKYIYVLIDSYSRYTFAYLLKSKDEAFDKFVTFAERAENKQGRRIKNVRSDNGGEFVNHAFENYFKEKGIHHERTVPYTPQSNGLAERTNRTILDKARTMLLSADLPSEFWGEAVMAAVHLQNGSPTKACGDLTPAEKWTNRKPSASHLKTFGCIAYFHIPKNQRNKIQPKAQKGIFVGYAIQRKAYRIYDVSTGEVHEARSVKFNECVSGSILLTKDHRKEDICRITYDTANEEEEMIIASGSTATVPSVDQPAPTDFTEDTNSMTLTQTRGRKKGDTDAVIQVRRHLERQEQENQLIQQGARRSERIKQRQEEANLTLSSHVPDNYEEAINSQHANDWKEAMQKELQSLQEHEVWELVPKSQASKVIKSKWVFTRKDTDDPEGKFKARLVAVGCSQKPGIDFSETYAPVLRLETFRLLMAIAAQQHLKIRQYDVKTAYLYGDLEEEIYMEQPHGFETNSELVCKLKKSLYGLPQSGRCWNTKFNSALLDIGLQRLQSDPCVYRYQNGDNFCYICIYVDDIMTIGSSDSIIDEVMTKIAMRFEIRNVQHPYNFLGITVEQHEDGSISLNQERYIEKILIKFGMENCNPVKTPGVSQHDKEPMETSPEMDRKMYQELLGSLMYLSVGTRPDITFEVSKYSQFNNDPRKCHLMGIKRIYRYLKGTKHLKLTYRRSENAVINASTDASWNSTADAKSFTGYTVKLGSSLITWKTEKQTLVTLSTCEAELIAICEGIREVKWITNVIEDLSMEMFIEHPTLVHSDSKSAIEWIKKRGISARTKHINRKYYFVKDEVELGNVNVKHVPSKFMEADMLTKEIPTENLNRCLAMVKLQ